MKKTLVVLLTIGITVMLAAPMVMADNDPPVEPTGCTDQDCR